MATGILGSGSLWSCHLLLLHLSSVKHPSRGHLAVQSASSEDGGKKRAEERGNAERQPQAGHPGHAHGPGPARRGREGEEGGWTPTCLPCRISEQASAGGHHHIPLPCTQPLMRAVGGAGGGRAPGQLHTALRGPTPSRARRGLKEQDKDCGEGWTRGQTEPQSLDKWP